MKKILLIILCMISNLTFAQENVNILYPYSAGATADIVIRKLASKLNNEKYNFIVVPAPGAAGLVALRAMKNSKNNTISIIGNGLLTFKDIDIEKDLTLITFLGYEPTLVVVNSKSTIQDIDDIYKEAKRRQVNFGSSGTGGYAHMSTAIIANNNKNIMHIPHKTSGQAALELLAGRIDFMVMDENLFERVSPNGQLRAIATNYHKRLKNYPTVKTLKEQGINNYNFYRWEILVSDPGLDKDLLKYLQEKFSDKDLLEEMSKYNLVIEDINKQTFFKEQSSIIKEIKEKFIIE